MLNLSQTLKSAPLLLAPLAGYSDLPFRLLCREFGAGLCASEMISAHGLLYQQKNTLKMLTSVVEEKPMAVQIFGADIAVMAQAADILNQFVPDCIDINMGCPVRKVTRTGAGAALMSTPETAKKILLEVIKNSQAPVTVKFRKGIDHNTINCIEFAKMAEDAGVAAITIHGRTWAQGFSGNADWDIIARAKGAVSIPVIGNGDITSYDQAMERLRASGCDGVMIGRGAIGNPWVFSDGGYPQEGRTIVRTVVRHLDLMSQYLEVEKMLAAIKNHIGRYFKNLQGSSAIRRTVYDCESFSELYSTMQHIRLSVYPLEDPKS